MGPLLFKGIITQELLKNVTAQSHAHTTIFFGITLTSRIVELVPMTPKLSD